MTTKEHTTIHEIGNTTYYVKASTKTGTVQDFKVAIQRLIQKEAEKKK